MNCESCGKECKSKMSLSQHKRFCPQNPNKQKTWLQRQFEEGKKMPWFSDPVYKKKQSDNAIGKTRTEEEKKKISESVSKYYSNPDNREKLSIRMRQAVLKIPDSYSKNNVSGRAKLYEYNGHLLKGTWELLVAKNLDHFNIKWSQPDVGFEYVWLEKTRLYFPDFYLYDLDVFIEVKGYEREQDRQKWKSISNLLIWKKNEIKIIENGNILSLLQI